MDAQKGRCEVPRATKNASVGLQMLYITLYYESSTRSRSGVQGRVLRNAGPSCVAPQAVCRPGATQAAHGAPNKKPARKSPYRQSERRTQCQAGMSTYSSTSCSTLCSTFRSTWRARRAGPARAAPSRVAPCRPGCRVSPRVAPGAPCRPMSPRVARVAPCRPASRMSPRVAHMSTTRPKVSPYFCPLASGQKYGRTYGRVVDKHCGKRTKRGVFRIARNRGFLRDARLEV